MITTLSREEVFKQSHIADQVIAGRQSFYFKEWKDADPADINAITAFYDHRTALAQHQTPLEGFCVLAYDAEWIGQPYEQGFEAAVCRLLEMLGIERVILLQDLAYGWNEFGFDTAEQRTQFLTLLPESTSNHGLLLQHSDLTEVLPLLYHNHPDRGRCSLFTLTDSLPLGLLYWKGNLHVSFDEKDRALLSAAAEESKLVMGDLEVAWEYHYGGK